MLFRAFQSPTFYTFTNKSYTPRLLSASHSKARAGRSVKIEKSIKNTSLLAVKCVEIFQRSRLFVRFIIVHTKNVGEMAVVQFVQA